MVVVSRGLSAGQIADQKRRRLRTLRERLDRLEETRGSGVSRVTFADRSVEFRPDADLERQIEAIERELNPHITRNLIVRASKGW